MKLVYLDSGKCRREYHNWGFGRGYTTSIYCVVGYLLLFVIDSSEIRIFRDIEMSVCIELSERIICFDQVCQAWMAWVILLHVVFFSLNLY